MIKSLLKYSSLCVPLFISTASIAESQLNSFSGEFLPNLFSNRMLHISVEDKSLFAESKGQGKFKLEEIKSSQYKLGHTPVTLYFSELKNNKYAAITLATPKGKLEYFRKDNLIAKYKNESKKIRPNGLADAILMDDYDSAKALIEQGSDLHELDNRRGLGGKNGRKPLNWAAVKNDLDVLALLVVSGADINGVNLSGYTPLHHAAESNSIDSVKLLLKLGADVSLKTKSGHTVFEVATMNDHNEIMNLLTKRQ